MNNILTFWERKGKQLEHYSVNVLFLSYFFCRALFLTLTGINPIEAKLRCTLHNFEIPDSPVC